MNTMNLTVLYDGGCPMCNREIGHYRTLESLKPVDWLDAASDDGALQRFGVTRADALAEFHVFDETGRLHKGADGFVTLWSALPYYRRLAQACLCLRLLPLMRWAYTRFARWHFRRRCASGVCGSPQ
jgi:predicted DCC family thiol-disulfide oxidoreductase YuxK